MSETDRYAIYNPETGNFMGVAKHPKRLALEPNELEKALKEALGLTPKLQIVDRNQAETLLKQHYQNQ